jgi:Fur family transcriptional regulator, zinc uptake regulator
MTILGVENTSVFAYNKGMTGPLKKNDIARLVKQVEAFCQKEGIRFTEPRRKVLEIIAGAKAPMGAYDVLEALGASLKNPKPPTAYRAIEFLSEYGFIHRIESLNAYVICDVDHRHTGSQFLICDSCGKVSEAHLCQLPADLEAQAQKQGFALSRWDAELHGTCGDCRAG